MQLVLHPDARSEIVEAADWYEARAPGLGLDLVSEVETALSSIAESPQSWPLWPDAPSMAPPIRRFLLSRFGAYALGYRIVEDRIVILAFMHCSREPFYWIERTLDQS